MSSTDEITIYGKEGSGVSRNNPAARRDVMSDPVYSDQVVAKLINGVMRDGKKGTAQKIVYGAFDYAEKEIGEDALEIFYQALNNIMPVLEVRARRIGGANYQVPLEVRPDRRQTLGLRWLVLYSRNRGERTMIERLGREIVDAYNNTGGAVRKKEEVHAMAEANKAFAHYRY